MNPFAKPMHTWNCHRYDGLDVQCTCFVPQCWKCRDTKRSAKGACKCLAADLEDEERWADWEAFKRDEAALMQETPEDDERTVEAHYNYWVNRGHERDQQKDTEERFGG